MTAYLLPPMAAKLLSLTLALQDPRCLNPESLIRQGRLLVKAAHDHGTKLPPEESIHLNSAGSGFLRAWAEHDPAKAVDLIAAAEVLEMVNELAFLVMEHPGAMVGPEAAA